MHYLYITILILSLICTLSGFAGYIQLRKVSTIGGLLLAAGIACLLTVVRIGVALLFNKNRHAAKIQIAALISTLVSLFISLVLFTIAMYRMAIEKDAQGNLLKTYRIAYASSLLGILGTFSTAVIVSVLFFTQHVRRKPAVVVAPPKPVQRVEPVQQASPQQFDARQILQSLRVTS